MKILVDYKHDQFAGSFNSFFPKRAKVHAGDTIAFKQFWSGEPHSVTMGTLVDELGKPFWDIIDPLFRGDHIEVPKDDPPGTDPFFETLPFMADEESLVPVQAAAQPCYLDEGAPDFSDPAKPCPKREQPAFNGRQSYYNSGFIPFQGEKGNSFTLPLADDIAPGTYHFYCNWHFVGMSGVVEVVPDSAPASSQNELNRKVRDEVAFDVGILNKALATARSGHGQSLPSVGAALDKEQEAAYPLFHAQIDEFVPPTVTTKVGEKVTWTFDGTHNIAFNVPKYFPVFGVKEDGTVTLDKRGFEAVKFPPPPEQPQPTGDGSEQGPPPEPRKVDGGTFDGTGGLHSTGVDYNPGDQFSLVFTKSGTYLFACLLHPPMVGKVIVK
jgi:plastocyanin